MRWPVLVGAQVTMTTLAVPAIVLDRVSPERASVQDVMLIVAGVPWTVSRAGCHRPRPSRSLR